MGPEVRPWHSWSEQVEPGNLDVGTESALSGFVDAGSRLGRNNVCFSFACDSRQTRIEASGDLRGRGTPLCRLDVHLQLQTLQKRSGSHCATIRRDQQAYEAPLITGSAAVTSGVQATPSTGSRRSSSSGRELSLPSLTQRAGRSRIR